MQFHLAVWYNPMDLYVILCESKQLNAIPCSFTQFDATRRSVIKLFAFHAIQCNSLQFDAVPQIPCSTQFYTMYVHRFPSKVCAAHPVPLKYWSSHRIRWISINVCSIAWNSHWFYTLRWLLCWKETNTNKETSEAVFIHMCWAIHFLFSSSLHSLGALRTSWKAIGVHGIV